ncbi:hypothetical protein SAMN05444398_104230 [Roseovarius pacificus]|uniref:Uncharacterized protein n=1 Tax=Roseovarius pacificus TaxID=337701 RepID=A0A1M7CGJ0_9RHOB|nr:hypothetical protein SAMN05444398_104230 [Roseovarius pacificus]
MCVVLIRRRRQGALPPSPQAATPPGYFGHEESRGEKA